MLEPEDMSRYWRQIDAMLNRAGTDDPETFAFIVKLLDDARDALPRAAQRLRTPGDQAGAGAPGYSWADLARALGVTKSAAAQRFRVRADDGLEPATDL